MGAVALADGAVQGLRLGSEQQVVEKFIIPPAILGKQQATSVAISMKGEKLAIGTASGNVFVVSGLDDLTSISDRVVQSLPTNVASRTSVLARMEHCGRLQRIARFDHGSRLPMDLCLKKWLDGISFLCDKSQSLIRGGERFWLLWLETVEAGSRCLGTGSARMDPRCSCSGECPIIPHHLPLLLSTDQGSALLPEI